MKIESPVVLLNYEGNVTDSITKCPFAHVFGYMPSINQTFVVIKANWHPEHHAPDVARDAIRSFSKYGRIVRAKYSNRGIILETGGKNAKV